MSSVSVRYMASARERCRPSALMRAPMSAGAVGWPEVNATSSSTSETRAMKQCRRRSDDCLFIAFLCHTSQLCQHSLPELEQLGVFIRSVVDRRQVRLDNADAVKRQEVEPHTVGSRVVIFNRCRRGIEQAIGSTNEGHGCVSHRLVTLAADDAKR